MKLEFLFMVGRHVPKRANIFGKHPYVMCVGCVFGVEYPNAYACACPTFDTQPYPSCFKTNTSDAIRWRRL